MRFFKNILSALATIKIPVNYVFARAPIMGTPDFTQKIRYPIVHPKIQDLIIEVTIEPIKSQVGITVDKFTGGSSRASCVFITIANALNTILGACKQNPPTRWPGKNPLWVLPEAGKAANAFYNRKTLSYFYVPQPGYTIYTSDSASVVAHECCHGILDIFRPDTWNVPSLEILSFHEAWADFMSGMVILHYNQAIDYLLRQTGGCLKSHNIVSDIAVEFSSQMHQIDSRFNQNFLRSALNEYVYTPPTQLPVKGSRDIIIREPHSFSRVFFGALYDIFIMMYEIAKQQKTPHDAVIQARTDIIDLMVETIAKVPLTLKFYESVAKTMLWIAFHHPNRPYYQDMRNIFLQRKIISPDLHIQTISENYVSGTGIVILSKQSVVKLAEISPKISIQATGGLRNVEIELPRCEAYMYNQETNTVMDQLILSEEDTILHAEEAVKYLEFSNSVGPNSDTPFEIRNNRLYRTNII